jgi:hypothetical protein
MGCGVGDPPNAKQSLQGSNRGKSEAELWGCIKMSNREQISNGGSSGESKEEVGEKKGEHRGTGEQEGGASK